MAPDIPSPAQSATAQSATAFGPDVVRAVTAHMNDDHAADTLVICRARGGVPDATAARMTGLDATGGDYTATVGGTDVPVRVPWTRTLAERADIRREVVRLYTLSCGELGIEPHAHE